MDFIVPGGGGGGDDGVLRWNGERRRGRDSTVINFQQARTIERRNEARADNRIFSAPVSSGRIRSAQPRWR